MEKREGPDRRAPRGAQILHDPRLNKGTAFTEGEREALGLRGLLPPRVFTQEEQEQRILANLRRLVTPLDKYLFLVALLDRNEQLFYRTVIDNLAELLPVLYTPTVGEACRQFGLIFRRPRGLYVSSRDRGRVRDVLRNWPDRHVAVVVVTDGERILGLGDLGAHGMGIPIGKLTLYTACGGLDPERGLPVMLDVGTDNEELRGDPQYIGLAEPRLRGDGYVALVDEFIAAVGEVFPGALVQFEDFGTANAFELLARYRDRACMFNDDIQGTAAVVLAGLLNGGRLTGIPLTRQRVLFAGAGVAIGAADLIVAALRREGTGEAEAREHCWFFDRDGLIVAGRRGIGPQQARYAHPHARCATSSRRFARCGRPRSSASRARAGSLPSPCSPPWPSSTPGRSCSRCPTPPRRPSAPRKPPTAPPAAGWSSPAAARSPRSSGPASGTSLPRRTTRMSSRVSGSAS